MADDTENDDQWLYGEQPDLNHQEEKEVQPSGGETPPESDAPVVEAAEEPDEPPPAPTEEEEEDDVQPPGTDGEPPEPPGVEPAKNGDAPVDEDEDADLTSDESDDDVNVVIGDIKTTLSYTSLNIKRSGLITASAAPLDKSKSGKFTIDEFDQSGMINGVPATEYNLDQLEEKPWRKPGADITDYFNYGFNEDTWRAYCERQKRMRLNESGAGLVAAQMTQMPRGPMPVPGPPGTANVPILNDNSKYSGNFLGVRKAGPPPGRRMTGSIDVIGAATTRPPPPKIDQPKMNVIQVMTADRREYSRKPGFPDMSVPPPIGGGGGFEPFQPEYGFNPEPEPFYGGYEPTQDSQWMGGGEAWQPRAVKTLTPTAEAMGPPPAAPPAEEARKEASPKREEEKERREASRARSERPRERERSHRRERSRSRSRRHKSRSRSPSHRHKRKKARRHEDSD